MQWAGVTVSSLLSLAYTQGPDPVWVACRFDAIGKQKDQAKRALKVVQNMGKRIRFAHVRRLCEQMYDYLSIAGGFENAAVSLVFVVEQGSVYQVAVMRYRYLPPGILGQERLSVDRPAGARCRIPNVPDRDRVCQPFEDVSARAKDPADRAHPGIALNRFAVARRYPC
jgi:hypothetical protein